MQTQETDVLIVGAGPTGLALATSLQQAGVRHILVDRLAEGQNTSRAAVIHAHTLEALDKIGVAGTLLERGLKLAQFRIRDRGRSLMTLRFGKIASPHPYLLMLPQDVTEAVLTARLAALGGQVLRATEVIAIEADASGATATLRDADGERRVRARFVVGGDGMHSQVRAAAGIDFKGAAYGENFILADVKMDWPIEPDEVSLYFSPLGLVVVAPLPDGSYRIVATVDEAPASPTLHDVQRILEYRGPVVGAIRVREVRWSSRFRVHHRLAGAYRNGSLFVMGDAAHVHSPAGGQGMNCGLIDALVLAEILSDVITGRRSEAALDQYEALRRPAAEEVLQLANRLTLLATVKGRVLLLLRNAALRLLDRVGGFKDRLLGQLSGISRRHRSGLREIQV